MSLNNYTPHLSRYWTIRQNNTQSQELLSSKSTSDNYRYTSLVYNLPRVFHIMSSPSLEGLNNMGETITLEKSSIHIPEHMLFFHKTLYRNTRNQSLYFLSAAFPSLFISWYSSIYTVPYSWFMWINITYLFQNIENLKLNIRAW